MGIDAPFPTGAKTEWEHWECELLPPLCASMYTPVSLRALAAVFDAGLYLFLQFGVASAIAMMLPDEVDGLLFGVSVWILALGLPLVLWSAYATVTLTFGEKAAGVIICDQNGQRPRFPRMFLRTFLWWLGMAAAFVGPLSVLFMQSRDGLHGRLSGTHVRVNWGPGRCACCGYSLHGLTSNRCPECGFTECQ